MLYAPSSHLLSLILFSATAPVLASQEDYRRVRLPGTHGQMRDQEPPGPDEISEINPFFTKCGTDPPGKAFTIWAVLR